MLAPKKILRWMPNSNDDTYEKMPGDFFYFPDTVWWAENQEVIQTMFDKLTKLGFIRGTVAITNQGLYVDYRLPTHKL